MGPKVFRGKHVLNIFERRPVNDPREYPLVMKYTRLFYTWILIENNTSIYCFLKIIFAWEIREKSQKRYELFACNRNFYIVTVQVWSFQNKTFDRGSS